MLTKALNQIRNQYLGAIALFLVLAGGTSYAAVHLAAGSVGTRQLRNGAVTNRKLAKGAVGARDLDRKTIGASVRAYARINGAGKLIASKPAATVTEWQTSGPPFGGTIEWRVPISRACFAMADPDTVGSPPGVSATAHLQSNNKPGPTPTYVNLSDPQVSVNVVVICPSR